MIESFLFVSLPRNLQFFEESKQPFARLEITACELDKVSGNGRLYRFAEKEQLRDSLINSPIFYGITSTGKHKKNEQVGFVESAKIVGNKIKAIVKVTSTKILNSLKSGFKNFLFSVGGVADLAKLIQRGAKKFIEMVGAKITHLNIWQSNNPKTAGFESAKLEKVLEFQESVLLISSKPLNSRNLALMVLSEVI